MHDANRICTRASGRFHGKRGCQPPVKQKEEETDRQGGKRVNRICMETVCQWVASSCGYLTLFPALRSLCPSSLFALPYAHVLPHLQRLPCNVGPSVLFFCPLYTGVPLCPSRRVLGHYLPPASQRERVTTEKLLFLNSSIILPRLTW